MAAVSVPAVVASTTTGSHAATGPTLQWVSECGAKQKTVKGAIGRRMLLDVCGNALPDLYATFTGTPGAGQVRFTKFTLAPASMPLRIEAVVTTSGSTGATSRAVGYDARTTSAPRDFTMPFTLDYSSVDLDFSATAPADSLDVLSEVFEPDATGARTNPQRVRVGFTPVPSSAGMSFTAGADHATLDLTTASPTVAVVAIDDESTAAGRSLSARIDRLPGHQTLSISNTGAGSLLTYAASGPTDLVDLTVHDERSPAMTGRATDLTARLEGVPSSVSLDFDPDAFEAATSGVLGRVVARLFSGTPGATLPAGHQGFIRVDTTTMSDALASFTGLRSARISQRPEIDVQVDSTAGGPLTVDLRQATIFGAPDQTLEALVDDLAQATHIRLSESSGGVRSISHSAADATGAVDLQATNLPWSGRSRNVQLALRDLPTSLSLGLGSEGGGVDLDAGGATLGSLEALLTSGPTLSIPTGLDGVALRDTAAQYTLAARISGLRRVAVVQEPLNVFLDSTAHRPFRLDLQEQGLDGGKVTFTSASITNLQPGTALRLLGSGGEPELDYSASGPTTSLALSTNAGARGRLDVTAAPVPASLQICAAAGTNECGNPAVEANRMSLRVLASSLTTVNLLDCLAFTCSSSGAQLRLNNLTALKFELNVHATQSCSPSVGCLPDGSKGEVWLDTDSVELRGQLLMDTGGDRLTGNFPTGFRANNRNVEWTNFIPVATSGSITCPSGTDLDLALASGVTIDIAGLYLC